jgi:hypothetical protein
MYQCFSHLVITFDVTFVLDVEMAVVIEKWQVFFVFYSIGVRPLMATRLHHVMLLEQSLNIQEVSKNQWRFNLE